MSSQDSNRAIGASEMSHESGSLPLESSLLVSAQLCNEHEHY